MSLSQFLLLSLSKDTENIRLMLFREIVSVQSGVKKQYFEVKAGGTYSVNCVVKEQQNFVSFFTCTLGHPLPVSLSDGTIKCCQTFEHVFSLRTKLRDEGNNVTCEVLPTDCEFCTAIDVTGVSDRS